MRSSGRWFITMACLLGLGSFSAGFDPYGGAYAPPEKAFGGGPPAPTMGRTGTNVYVLPSKARGDGFATMSTPQGPGAANEQFTYDRLGNRYQAVGGHGFTQTYTHNNNNQYTQIHEEYAFGLSADFYPEYDANGNLKRDKYGFQYSYDYRDRLTKVQDASSGTIVEYGYDGLGRRIKKVAGGKTTYYYYDAFGRVISEYEKPDDGTEKPARSLVHGNGKDEVLAMFLPEKPFDPNSVLELAGLASAWLTDDETYDYDSSGTVDLHDYAVLAADGGSLPTTKETHFYYLKDALGSVVGIVGGKFRRESDREFYLYDAYGRPSEASFSSAAANPYRFAGYLYDPETGLYYMVNRTYDPETGRFLQTDPIGYADSMNLYEYVMSNPTNWVDPYGLKSLYKDQWSWLDRFRFEHGMVGGRFGLSYEQTRRMDNYWLQYQRAQMLNQHPNEAKEYCKAAKSIASGCAKNAMMGYCHYIVYVDENGYGAVRDKIIGYVAEPYTNRILMCYEYNGQDLDQAINDACNWQMVGADLVGLTDMSYGVDYLRGKESIDTTTGRTFSGQEQYVRGLQGTSQFCGAVAACAQGAMSCGATIADATRAAPGAAIENANFAQKTFSEAFGKGGQFAGQTIDDVAGALRAGKFTPTDVPIDYIIRDGNTLILNTRSSQALMRAGIPRSQWNAVNRTGQGPFENNLTRQLSNNRLTSQGIPTVRPSGGGG